MQMLCASLTHCGDLSSNANGLCQQILVNVKPQIQLQVLTLSSEVRTAILQEHQIQTEWKYSHSGLMRPAAVPQQWQRPEELRSQKSYNIEMLL